MIRVQAVSYYRSFVVYSSPTICECCGGVSSSSQYSAEDVREALELSQPELYTVGGEKIKIDCH